MDRNMIGRRISPAAIEARVRRVLARDGQVLRKPRGERERQQLGDYFTVSAYTGYPERGWLALDDLARECNALRAGAVAVPQQAR